VTELNANRDLTEVGTRYDHYQELKELWMGGVEVLTRMHENYKTASDEVMRKQLEGAISLIDKQLDILSGFDRKKFDLLREIEAIPRNPESIK